MNALWKGLYNIQIGKTIRETPDIHPSISTPASGKADRTFISQRALADHFPDRAVWFPGEYMLKNG